MGHRGLGAVPGFQVGGEGGGPVSGFRRDLGHEIGAVHQQDAAPFGGGAQGDGAADPLGGPGHDQDLAREAPGKDRRRHALAFRGALGVNFS